MLEVNSTAVIDVVVQCGKNIQNSSMSVYIDLLKMFELSLIGSDQTSLKILFDDLI